MDPVNPTEVEKLTAGNASSEVKFNFWPFIRTYKDGRVERLFGTDVAPPSFPDPATGVSSKDVPILPDLDVFARLYLPKDTQPGEKLPVLVYCHGGAFCVESASSPTYHVYLNAVVSRCRVLAVSVNYRLAPEHLLPAAYEDCWAVLNWVFTAARGEKERWLAEHADLERLFIAGDSAGANICHWLAVKTGEEEGGGDANLPSKVEIEGMVLVHPYFWGKEAIGSETTDPMRRSMSEKSWKFVVSSEAEAGKGTDHPWLNPWVEGAPRTSKLACRRVLICAAERDFFRDRSWLYYNKLRESGWPGKVQIIEIPEEEHVFHLIKPSCDRAEEMLNHLATFVNGDAA